MALLPVSETSNIMNPSVNPSPMETRPKQPTSLQGLLRFSMGATRAEENSLETFGPIDEERKKFLEGALSSMTLDVVEILQKQIKILKGVQNMTENAIVDYLKALDCIMDYVDNIDTANDFYKIGGFQVIHPCLKSKSSKIRAMTCELVGILCQNNPYCQKVVLENEFVPFLLNMIENDGDTQVVVKAIFALGGIIRENEEGTTQFLQYRGLPILFKCLRGNDDTMTIKTCFLLSSICRKVPDVKKELVKIGYVHQLLTVFMIERCPSHEYILSLLVTIMDDNPAALKECQTFKFNVKEVVQRYLSKIKNKENIDEKENCRRILHMINAER